MAATEKSAEVTTTPADFLLSCAFGTLFKLPSLNVSIVWL